MLNSAVSAVDTQLAEIKVAFQSCNIMKQLLVKNFDEILFTFCSTPLVYIYSCGVKTICSSRNFSNFANLSSFPIPRLSFKPLRINETLLEELLEHVNKNLFTKMTNFFTAPPGDQLYETKVNPIGKFSNFCF